MLPDKLERWSWHCGVALATFSGFVFTANNVLTQYFDIDAIQILLVRSVAQIVIFGMVAKLRGVRDHKTCPLWCQNFQKLKELLISVPFPTLRLTVLSCRRLLPNNFSSCLFVVAQMMLSGITLYLGFR